jgi:hypothetical protein
MARSAATLAGDGLTYVVPRRLEISSALLAKWFIYMSGKVNASITGRDCRGRSRVLFPDRDLLSAFDGFAGFSVYRALKRTGISSARSAARHEGAFIRTFD